MIELPVASEEERDEFYDMLCSELRNYEQVALTNLGLTWESHAELFRTVGEVRAVLADGKTAGFVWIELHPPTLYVQSLILSAGFRGRGIGRQVFHALEREYCDAANTMVVGTLTKNRHVTDFYRRIGFVPSVEQSTPGFTNFGKAMCADLP
jgi:ribosomal protein S18 acetylase RimI-like enzyme